jgi:hypothetical protein
MKKNILLLLILFISSCSSDETEEKVPIDSQVFYDKLKAYKKNISFYYYSDNSSRVGIYRIYLDTISGGITQYTSHRESPNQNDTSELFGIKSSSFYPNYKNTNVDYMSYEVNNSSLIILLSHEINTDKFTFKRLDSNSKIIFSNDYPNGEFYKKLN